MRLSSEIIRDVIGNRPVAASAGRIFFSTDEGAIYRDDGAVWQPITLVSSQITDLALMIQQETYTSADDTGTANAYIVTLSPVPTLGPYSLVVFKAAHANTGASTLAVNGGSAIPIKKLGGTALASGDIALGEIICVIYDGTNFQLIGATPTTGGTVTSVALTVPSWLSVAGSPVTGSGTLAVTATSGETANEVLATPDGTTGAVSLRALVAADIPALAESKITNLVSDLALKAPLASPTFTGTPAAPTPSTADSSTKIATTAYVQAQGYVTAGSGPGNGSIATKTAAYTVLGTDYTLLGDATSAAFSFTLPVSPTSGEIHNFKKIDSSAHDITVSGNGKNIDGGSTLTISAQYASFTVQYDGTQWWVI